MILGWQKTFLADCVLASGDPAAAALIAEEAVQAASETGDRMPLALAKRALADAVVRGGGQTGERADTLMREAIQILEEVGAQPELARTYVRHAALLRLGGDEEAARQCVATSLAMFESMRMIWDEARARALLVA